MMAFERFRTIVDAYGADPDRWPADERAEALALVACSAEASAYAQQAEALDTLLDAAPLRSTATVDAAAFAILIARTSAHTRGAAASTGATVTPFAARAARKPASLVSRAFGWPNFAALAAAGVVGFLIGWSNLNAGAGFGNRDLLDLMSPVTTIEEPVW
jgi:hypothetical protein